MNWRQPIDRIRQGMQTRRLRVLIQLVLGIALCAFFGWYVWRDWGALVRAGISFNPQPLCAAFALYGFNFALLYIVWRGIVTRFGGPRGWRQNALLYADTHITKFLPTPTWFLASRIYLYGRTGLPRRTALTMTGLESLLHMLSGMVFYAMLSVEQQSPVTWLYLLIWLPIVALLLRPRWLEFGGLRHSAPEAGLRTQDVAVWFGVNLVTWVVAGPFFVLVIRSFTGVDPLPVRDLWRVWALSGSVAYISAYLLGGMGLFREFTLTWLLAGHYTYSVSLVIALGVRLVLTGAGIAWGLMVSLVSRLLSLGQPSFLQPQYIEEDV